MGGGAPDDPVVRQRKEEALQRELDAMKAARKAEKDALVVRKKELAMAQEVERLAIERKKLEAETRVTNALIRLEEDLDIKATDLVTEDDKKLCVACHYGDTEAVAGLIRARPERATQQFGEVGTPLMIACRYGHEELARSIIGHGASADTASPGGLTPFPWGGDLVM